MDRLPRCTTCQSPTTPSVAEYMQSGDITMRLGRADADPVRVFVVLLSPPGRERDHVKLLARICRLMRHENFIDKLEAAENDEALVHIIEAIDAQHA